MAANALRYSPAGPPPLLTASALADRVELRVIDRGPGIPAADRDRIFTPFQRLGDTDNTTGVGLGLALSRGLTEAMGGTLVPEDTPGGGLTMVLRCPSPVPPACRARGRAAVAADWCRDDPVLVVDDEPQILRALRVNLRARRTRSQSRRRHRGAGGRRPHHPDLVILDLGLPDLDGVEVVQGLRGWTTVPIIILSGRADSWTRSRRWTPAPTTT